MFAHTQTLAVQLSGALLPCNDLDPIRLLAMQLTAREQQRFQESYATILRAHMDALKRRDKKASKAAKKG